MFNRWENEWINTVSTSGNRRFRGCLQMILQMLRSASIPPRTDRLKLDDPSTLWLPLWPRWLKGGRDPPRWEPTTATPRTSAPSRQRQTLQGSFSAVSKPNFASKCAFESSRRDLRNAFLCTAFGIHNRKLQLYNLNFCSNFAIFCLNFANSAKLFSKFAKFHFWKI